MRKFSLAQLEAFLWICRLGTFHAAAERLNLTQPTVSLRIRELESALGARLFERRGNGMRLSAEGTILLRYAERAWTCSMKWRIACAPATCCRARCAWGSRIPSR